MPFLRSVQFGVDVRMEKKEAEIPVPPGEIADLQVDYWPSSAPVSGRKEEQQQSMKVLMHKSSMGYETEMRSSAH